MIAENTENNNGEMPKYCLPAFSCEVTTQLEAIKVKMPFWFHHFEMYVFVREVMNEDHHPVLFTLAYLMLHYEGMKSRTRKRSLRNWYPLQKQDFIDLGIDDTIEAKIPDHSINNPKHITCNNWESLFKRARSNLLTDIQALLHTASEVGDFGFFNQWGQTCLSVARYYFGAKHIRGKRNWRSGVWTSETEWEGIENGKDSSPTVKSPLRIQILKARLHLYLEHHRIPTNDEVAELIIDQLMKIGRWPPGRNPKTFVKTVAKTTMRLGLSTCVIERKVKNGDKSE